MPELFHRLPRNVITIFSGRNLLWHALAIGLTVLIVVSGTDWLYIGFSVSTTIHWLSEFVAGAIIGSLIGVVVGRSFRMQLI